MCYTKNGKKSGDYNLMKICVVGLGLIGGSMCLALKRAGHNVDGYNRSSQAIDYALAHNIIDGVAKDFTIYDVVFVALPPKACIEFIKNTNFKSQAIVSDICGVKKILEDAVYSMDKDIRYIGTHPMAGKEVSGIANACVNLYDRASMVLTIGQKTNSDALNIIKGLVKDMGFARIVECSAQVHDQKIAYTSQLAHIVSNCYVKDKTIATCLGFTGGSFQDMTRIAGVDEGVWTELYLANADNLSSNISKLIDNLSDILNAIKGRDEEQLKALLKIGKDEFLSGKANSFSCGDIKTTVLHN
jgi:prephenate dehydrogenase